MKEFWNTIQLIFSAVGGWLGYFLGGCDGLLYALIAFVVIDYITGVMCAIINRELSSAVGFKGIFRKVLIFLLVGIANIIDVQVIGTGAVLRTAVIFFYISNEGVSLLENAGHLGLPIPEKIKTVLEQLHDRAENGKEGNYTKLSPNHSGQRTHSIDRITPHCVVGQLTAESICGCFTSPSREASCNYGIGKDGKIALCVEEKNRSWCSSSSANDQRAVTIECASDLNHPYAMTTAVYNSLVKLCTDICKRNGKKKLLWLGDKNKTLNYSPKSDEMVLTVHRWFANKSCPGDWLYSRLGDLASKVTAALGGSSSGSAGSVLYRVRKRWSDAKSQKGAFNNLDNAKKCADSNAGYSVFDESGKVVYTGKQSGAGSSTGSFLVQVTATDLNIRKGPGTNYAKTGKYTGKGVFTITEVKSGTGSVAGWGKLKSGAGWISLDYCKRL